ncbi:MAG: heterodisulfide reductase subunit C [Deltaproteobacteria bacterium RBG_13_52_11]|nr:MAG: heterodisulfide reductase subunit C [Deltaproteobacteria bacterium RBG_13_52_11]
METINAESIDRDFIQAVEKESGQYISHCYQCGNCTAGCPLNFVYDIPVHQIMRLVQVGQKEKVLRSHAIWLCATCETCTTRCPCEVDVARVMDVLRIMARREGTVSEEGVQAFYDAFLDSVKSHGRLYELGVIMKYNLHTKRPFTDAELGPKLLGKGKIHFVPKNIKGARAVKEIFGRFAKKRGS